MALLWDRAIEITIGSLQIKGLRMQFNVKRSLRKEPNDASVKIWNLSRESRYWIEEDNIPVLIEAGYQETISQIFLGNMRRPKTARDGSDTVTALQAGDGEQAIRSARSNFSFRPGATVTDVLKKLIDALGLAGMGTKDAKRKVSSVKLRGAITSLVNGVVASGNSYQQLQGLFTGTGYEASVQDGQLQIIEVGKTTQELAVQLTNETGLIGAPQIGEKGKVKLRSLLQPRIRPGRKVEVVSEFINGFYRAEVVQHLGDTHGQEWYTDIEGNAL